MKLSIIIPYYNTENYTNELLDRLSDQINDEVEVLLIDDGSDTRYTPKYEWLKTHRIKHSGQSKARNVGLNKASGDYIQFIDSDDLVAKDFIKKILEKIEDKPDLIEYSWKSFGTKIFDFKVSEGKRLPNPSASTRCFSRKLIGSRRFNENKDAAEDEDFTRHLGIFFNPLKVSVIPEYMYFYRTDVEGSNTKNYRKGLCKTKRIIYYYNTVTANRKDILEAIKEDDKQHEVFLMTDNCEIQELYYYCQIIKPCRTWAHYLKGEPCGYVTIIPVPETYSKIIYVENLYIVGGLETFIYNFGLMFDDVALLVKSCPTEQTERLKETLKVIKYDPFTTYNCDTLIMIRISDVIPGNVRYQKSVRMCHACKANGYRIKQDCDYVVNVSEVSQKSFEGEAGIVIHNPITKSDKRALILVSATRIPAPDKGHNEERMRRLAVMLNDAKIPFVWFNFSNGEILAPGIVNLGVRYDMQAYIKRADYTVLLSDTEGWPYAMLESLINNVPVICTPFDSAYEMGVKDGENGYIVPFDMDFDVNKLLTVPEFEYNYDQKPIKTAWEKIFKSKPKRKAKKGNVKIFVLRDYTDMELNRGVRAGETIEVSPEQARKIIAVGYGKGG